MQSQKREGTHHRRKEGRGGFLRKNGGPTDLR